MAYAMEITNGENILARKILWTKKIARAYCPE